MNLKLSDLTTDRKWRSATGLDQSRFYKLLPYFQAAYLEQFGKSIATKQAECDSVYCIQTEEALLYFTLFSLKSDLTYDLLGIVSGMTGSNAKRYQTMGLTVLNRALQTAGCAPKRSFSSKKEFHDYFKSCDILLIDATEQRIQRPSDSQIQSEFYSGKKKHIQSNQL